MEVGLIVVGDPVDVVLGDEEGVSLVVCSSVLVVTSLVEDDGDNSVVIGVGVDGDGGRSDCVITTEITKFNMSVT